jgi:hypothetical protein
MKEVLIGLSLAALAAIVVPAVAAHTSAPLEPAVQQASLDAQR